jgi:hypothetical protein
VFVSKEGGETMKKGFLVFSVCLMAVFMAASQANAVDVYAEGAYTDTDVQVCIYADIENYEALRSFGVRLVYNGTELAFDGTKSKKNEAVWFLGDGTPAGNHAYRDPEDVDVDGTNRAVVIIGGKLDVNETAAQVAGSRVLLGTVWFARNSGTGALANPLTIDIGKPEPYANFVIGANEGDVLDPDMGLPVTANVFRRGDADGDGVFTTSDMLETKQLIKSNVYKCYADCDKDGVMTTSDMLCIKDEI